MNLRLMAVHAHPDDESSKGAATTARYAAESVEVLVVSCTGGERGDVLNPSFGAIEPGLAAMAALRRREMAAAVRALGVQHRWLGFVDSGLPTGDPPPPLPDGCFALVPLEVSTRALVEVVREFRPHVMTTYDSSGGYSHPDHVRCHEVSVAAWRDAADPDRFPDAGEPWAVAKLYYDAGFSLAHLRAMHDALQTAGLTSPFAEWIGHREAVAATNPREVTTQVECAAYFPARDAALRAHASQVDPEGFFFAIPRDVEARIWPYEDFELADARIPVSLPEDDLFAGLREAADA